MVKSSTAFVKKEREKTTILALTRRLKGLESAQSFPGVDLSIWFGLSLSFALIESYFAQSFMNVHTPA